MILALLGALAMAAEGAAIFPEPAPPVPSARLHGEFSAAPVPHWEVQLPGRRLNTARHTERARPVVAGDLVLVGSAAGEALYALSRRNGVLVRSFPAHGSVESAATVVDDRVFFTDTAGHTWCYDLDGTLIWSHASGAPILVEPTVHEGRVYVTNVDDLAVVLDAGTGELDWQYRRRPDLAREAELALFAAPPAVIMDEQVLLGFSDGAIVGLDRVRGEVIWERSVGEGRYPDAVAAPVPYEGEIYAAGYFLPLVSIDAETRNVRWRLDIGAAHAVHIDADRDPAILYHPGTDGRLRAVVARSGDPLWTWDSGTGSALTTPVPTEAGLLVGAAAGSIYLIDPQTGAELWRLPGTRMLDGLSAAPTVEGRQLLFVTNAGRLYSMVAPRPPREGWRRAETWRRGDARRD